MSKQPKQDCEELSELEAWRKHRERQRQPIPSAPRTATQPKEPPRDDTALTLRTMGEKRILYCHSARQTRTVGPGHWFFHTGQWAHCASARRTRDGKWYIGISFGPRGKCPHDETRAFPSIEEVKRFISEYFEMPVAEVKPSDFPRPEDL
jgi:hypothetical protein